jgi:hypothetical protein
VGERLLRGEPFKPSDNDYDWLGPGIYFWENNWQRGLEFAREQKGRADSGTARPFVIGAVIDLGTCLDLTTKGSLDFLKIAHRSLIKDLEKSGSPLPKNSPDRLKHNLDCAVIKRVHSLFAHSPELERIQTVKGVFVEGEPVYAGSTFYEKTHIQIAVCDHSCIKGVFRVREL